MDTSSSPQEVRSQAKLAYEAIEAIWPDTDEWSVHTKHCLADFIRLNVDAAKASILNAGAGGHDYKLGSAASSCISLDISYRQCLTLAHSVVGDVAMLPFPNQCFDVVVCVGAVINYSEPYEAIPELVRVLRGNGLILLDFETSDSAELLFSGQWKKRVSVVERLYAGRLDKTFLFSVEHVRRILVQSGISIIGMRRYHVSTAIWQRIFPSSRLPKIVLSADNFMARFPGVNSLASNVIFVGRKL